MVKLIDDKQIELKEVCGRFGVKTLAVFGSAAQGEGFTDQSDLDFLVEFLAMPPADHADAYFGLLTALRELFNRGIDLLEVKAIDNPYLLESINRHRVELYAA
ncbi:MAG: nucleotidyltransferase domain-containing protein [Planctomycetota bacterium]